MHITVKNPQGNSILEWLDGGLDNILHIAGVTGKEDSSSVNIKWFIINAAWAVHFTHLMVLSSPQGAAMFG